MAKLQYRENVYVCRLRIGHIYLEQSHSTWPVSANSKSCGPANSDSLQNVIELRMCIKPLTLCSDVYNCLLCSCGGLQYYLVIRENVHVSVAWIGFQSWISLI